jgi:hypothetical protein
MFLQSTITCPHCGLAKTEIGRLLRVLFLRLGALPADSDRARGRERRGLSLCGVDSNEHRDRRKHARLAA